MKSIIDKIRSIFSEKKEEQKAKEVEYFVVELDPIISEYGIPEEYVDETMWVITHYVNNTPVYRMPYSKEVVEYLRTKYPVLYRVVREPKARYIVYESILKIED